MIREKESLVYKVLMDTVAHLKQTIVTRIEKTNDVQFLRTIEKILSFQEQPLYHLSENQIASIEKGKDDILNGRVINHENLMNELQEWIKNK